MKTCRHSNNTKVVKCQDFSGTFSKGNVLKKKITRNITCKGRTFQIKRDKEAAHGLKETTTTKENAQ